jgi:hypothetical protein
MPAFAAAQNPAAAEEIRQYEVLVKDKPVGNVSIRILQAADGATTAWTDTTVEAGFLFIKYRYEFHDQETWNGDRLVNIESRTSDNGKLLSVQAATDSRGSNIQISGQASRLGPPLALTENYWQLPAAAATAADFSLIEPDTGILHQVRMQLVGPDRVTVEGQQIACNHYRLTGGAAAELWFDNQGRMVRQQTVEQGYPTEQRLVRIRTGGAQPGGQASLAGYQN